MIPDSKSLSGCHGGVGSILRRVVRHAIFLAAGTGISWFVPALAQESLPPPDATPSQRVGRTAEESDPPRWPRNAVAPKGAPNILLILTDDVGFGATATFGGVIPTPTLDRLAAHGIKYNRFHTAALCSPTRASLLTGRSPHNAGMGNVANLPTGYDGYASVVPKSTGMISETLRQHGYNTAVIGKWHLTPEWEESRAGPFDRWPAGQGFEYFYGFLGGDTDQFAPTLIENTLPLAPPTNDPGYILDRDLADHASHWLRSQHELAPGKPFFLYYAPGSTHSPHQAPKQWLAKFRGRFDAGWDVIRSEIHARQLAQGTIPPDTKLTARPAFLPAWDSLPPQTQRLYARLMEAYAAQLAFSDHEIGRVVDTLEQEGELDNTLIMFIEGDNGASAEGGKQGLLMEEAMINGVDESLSYLTEHSGDIGGPNAHNHVPAAWAWAMDCPFQYYKQVASHFGGTRNPLVVSWPRRLEQLQTIRQQVLHVSDVVPTLLEAVGIGQPAVVNGVPQKPLDGMSFAATFRDPQAAGRRTLVFEMMQNLGVYQDGWFAGTTPAAAPWDITKAQHLKLDDRNWELYHVATDFSQSQDLAAGQPEKLHQMQELFFAEAARNGILPIHGIAEGAAGRPSLSAGRTVFELTPGMTRVPENTAPRIIGRSWKITAEVTIPAGGASGVIITQGGRFGGYAFYLQDGKPVFHYNAIGERQYSVRSANRVAGGRHQLAAEFNIDQPVPGAGGILRIAVDGAEVAKGRIEHTHRTWISNSEGLDVGEDSLTPINSDYTIAHSKFSGELSRVVFELQ